MSIFLKVFGGTALALGILASIPVIASLEAASDVGDEPQKLTVDQLLAKGYGENRHVRLVDAVAVDGGGAVLHAELFSYGDGGYIEVAQLVVPADSEYGQATSGSTRDRYRVDGYDGRDRYRSDGPRKSDDYGYGSGSYRDSYDDDYYIGDVPSESIVLIRCWDIESDTDWEHYDFTDLTGVISKKPINEYDASELDYELGTRDWESMYVLDVGLPVRPQSEAVARLIVTMAVAVGGLLMVLVGRAVTPQKPDRPRPMYGQPVYYAPPQQPPYGYGHPHPGYGPPQQPYPGQPTYPGYPPHQAPPTQQPPRPSGPPRSI